VREEDLRKMTVYMEHLQNCIVRLEANQRVLTSLEKFYTDELLQDLERYNLVDWLEDAKRHIRNFKTELHIINIETEETLQRARVLDTLAKSRETLVSPASLLFQVLRSQRCICPYHN
jgi:hypothetical protein